jgi:hypothetical protein
MPFNSGFAAALASCWHPTALQETFPEYTIHAVQLAKQAHSELQLASHLQWVSGSTTQS